jgi:hypothetical protein
MMLEGSSDVMSSRSKTVVRVAEASIGEASAAEAHCARPGTLLLREGG